MYPSHTIETGLCLYGSDTHDVLERVKLAERFGCTHFQLRSSPTEVHTEIRRRLRALRKAWYSTSSYLDSSTTSEQTVARDIANLLDVGAEATSGTHFVVVGGELIRNVGLVPETLEEIVATCVPLASKHNGLIALENSGFESALDTIPALEAAIKSGNSDRFLAFLNLDNLPFDALRRHQTFVRTSVLGTSYGRGESNGPDLLASTLKDLFYIPYKQRPLVFTDLSQSIERTLELFRSLTASERLFYY